MVGPAILELSISRNLLNVEFSFSFLAAAAQQVCSGSRPPPCVQQPENPLRIQDL